MVGVSTSVVLVVVVVFLVITVVVGMLSLQSWLAVSLVALRLLVIHILRSQS